MLCVLFKKKTTFILQPDFSKTILEMRMSLNSHWHKLTKMLGSEIASSIINVGSQIAAPFLKPSEIFR